MNEDKIKLKKRIQHWAEHNDEHTARLRESAKTAETLGLSQVAQALLAAAAAGRIVSDELRKAETSIS